MKNTLDELRSKIKAMPEKIQESSKFADDLRSNLRKAELAYDIAFNHSFLEAKGSVAEKRAQAELDNVGLQQKVNEAKTALARAVSAIKYGDDVFIALRKEASTIEAELRGLNYMP